MSDAGTLAVYDRMAEDYARLTDRWEPPGLSAFLRRLPAAARVLDLGCGTGRDAERFAADGHRVLAVDGSSEMVERAAARPGVTVRQAVFDDIPVLGRFDGVWASFSLLHATRAAFPGHLAALRSGLEAGGVLGLGMKLGEGEGTDHLGRFYTYYTEDELRTHLAEAGFAVAEAIAGADRGLAGKTEPWLMILADA
jgi:SAM-dependent methyltransferase